MLGSGSSLLVCRLDQLGLDNALPRIVALLSHVIGRSM